MLTANYMPGVRPRERRSDPFVTKSGSSRYTGNASFFWRDESLQANTWSRNRSTNAAENRAGAVRLQAVRLLVRRPDSRRCSRTSCSSSARRSGSTSSRSRPTRHGADRSDAARAISASCSAPNRFFSTRADHRDPLTGQPFPNNIIPAGRLSPNGIALMNLYPPPTTRLPGGLANLIIDEREPAGSAEGQHPLRLPAERQATSSRTAFSDRTGWRSTRSAARSRSRAPTGIGRTRRRTSTGRARITNNLINEFSYSHSLDEVFINVFTESGLHKRSRTGINYPYIFPDNKEIEDKIPTGQHRHRSPGSTAGRIPAFSQGPIHTFSNTSTLVKGRHTFKAGVVFEYSGEDDFDQINVQADPGRHQQPERPVRVPQQRRTARTGVGIADMALGLFTDYAELGQRAFTKWRSLATDIFLQDSWRPTANLTDRRRLPLGVLAAVVLDDEQHRELRPALLRSRVEAVINPSTGRLVGGARYNGIVLPGDGFEGEGNDLVVAGDPRVQALFRGEPRGFSRRTTTSSSRARRVLLAQRQDDPADQRRCLPQPRHAERLDAARRQSAVPADGRRVERQRRQSRRRKRRHRPAVRDAGAGRRLQAPDVLACGRPGSSARSRSGSSSTPPTSAAAVCICSASGTSISCSRAQAANPGVNIAALRP